ncbi:MAG: hypothetical protein ACI9EF_002572, partial [Pseudohongiellaceae bacterium]
GPRHQLVSGRDAAGRKIVLRLADEDGGAVLPAAVESTWYQLGELSAEQEITDVGALSLAELAAYQELEAAARQWFESSANARPSDVQESVDNMNSLKALGYTGDGTDSPKQPADQDALPRSTQGG